jgi:hypothetical protein
MKLKVFLTASVSLAALCFPYNIIGCAGGDADPYDYFVSFFHNDLPENGGHKQFYYTNTQFLYDTQETQNVAQLTANEWTGYGNNAFGNDAAYDFVCRYAWKDLNNLYYHLEKNQALKIPDSVKRNGMTQFFMTGKDLEALGYVMYAKQVEPHTTGEWSSWEPVQRDKMKMDKLIKSGQQLYKAAKKDFIKLRYAYQLLRLAHYSGRFADCKKWYDELVATNTTGSVLQDLSLSLKAGALMRTGEKTKAAYIFSKLFSKSDIRRVSNYMSFDWCVKRFDESNRSACMKECKTNEEKADLLGLFLLGSNVAGDAGTLKKIFDLSPSAALLEILTTREINKLEEFYFTRSIGRDPGSLYSYDDEQAKKAYDLASKEMKDLIGFCNKVADNNSTRNKGLFKLAAAHTAFMMRDYAQARKLLGDAKGYNNSDKIKDQWQLTSLLVTINETEKIDAGFEKALLTQVKWLEQKARKNTEYNKFFRRLFADVLAPRYKAQKEMHKYVLAQGAADYANRALQNGGQWEGGTYLYGSVNSTNALRNELTGQQVEDLVQLMESSKANEFEKWMMTNCVFDKDDVNDVAGTAWLRQENWDKAIDWFKKVDAKYYDSETYKTWMAANPFADLMTDVHTKTNQDTKRYTKLSFAQKMKQLKAAMNTGNNEAMAKATYEYATGLYHMGYWGNSWMLVEYGWSTYAPERDKLEKGEGSEFAKWYYTANNAEAAYNKVVTLTANKELKARSLYMAAKCAQKSMGDMPRSWEDDYLTKKNGWLRNFDKKNNYFSKLKKEYGQTAFYNEAYGTCSYLSDFVKLKP